MYISSYIPFDGFYESFIDDSIYKYIESEINYFNENNNTDYNYSDIDYKIDYSKIAYEWSIAFISSIEKFYKIEIDYQFEKLICPKEYNFSNDAIEIKINKNSLNLIYKKHDKDILKNLVHERLKSRSGFIPFYSNNLDNWNPEISQWSKAQLELFFESVMMEIIDDHHVSIFEYLHFDEWLSNCLHYYIDINFPNKD